MRSEIISMEDDDDFAVSSDTAAVTPMLSTLLVTP
jgi:hypothetical protein